MISEFLRRNSFQSWWNDFERRPPTSFCLFKVSKRSYMVIVICVLYVYLEPQATIYKWLFQLDASKSLYRKWLFHQTSIYKWLFGVPGTTTCFTCFWKPTTNIVGALRFLFCPGIFGVDASCQSGRSLERGGPFGRFWETWTPFRESGVVSPAWRITPVSKWLVTCIYKPWKGHLEGE